MLSPTTARDLGVVDEDVVRVLVAERSLAGPVLTVPGHADGAVTLPLGYGRDGSESIARGVGFSAYALRTAAHRHFATAARIERTGARYPLARSQRHFDQMGRGLALHATLAQYRAAPDAIGEASDEPTRSLLPVVEQGAPRWGMTIDTSACTGCSACVVACQAENNTPVVGKQGVDSGRIMHWLRIDEYREGPEDDPRRVHQPMLCQHCEKAPCEYVCPVYATTHSPDGINEMVYNRCVGTRFCSNNCPYKVRRFNWFDYTRDGPERLQYNPQVTVRARGVMEKCTYCVQRIRNTQIDARLEGRDVATGEIETACQQACPTRAIEFGDLARSQARVSVLGRQPRSYSVLGELGTRPRTRYLARIVNENEELG